MLVQCLLAVMDYKSVTPSNGVRKVKSTYAYIVMYKSKTLQV